MTLELKETQDGLLLSIQAQPGARRNQIVGEHDGRLKVDVTQVPENGKANKAIIKLLAKEFGVSKSRLSMVSGESSTKKQLEIGNFTKQEFCKILRSLGISKD